MKFSSTHRQKSSLVKGCYGNREGWWEELLKDGLIVKAGMVSMECTVSSTSNIYKPHILLRSIYSISAITMSQSSCSPSHQPPLGGNITLNPPCRPTAKYPFYQGTIPHIVLLATPVIFYEWVYLLVVSQKVKNMFYVHVLKITCSWKVCSNLLHCILGAMHLGTVSLLEK